MSTDLSFPLYDRAKAAGVLSGDSALIVAPTATGKSHIGRSVIRRALDSGRDRTHAYLVPYRALATEVHDTFQEELDRRDVRLRIVTGDYRDPRNPEEADLVVATYESFAGLLRRPGFRPGMVVADEVHLIADDGRGPVVEALLAKLLTKGGASGLCGLSAVVENGRHLADWLGVKLIEGCAGDRPVPLEVEYEFVDELDDAVVAQMVNDAAECQALVFCNSRRGAERLARKVADALGPAESSEAAARRSDLMAAIGGGDPDPDAEAVAGLIDAGVAFHHAGLSKRVRRRIEAGYRQGVVRVIAATPTLAAGVNLPAALVVVRDVFRGESVRGVFRQTLLPSGEVLNMLGRAARPYHVDRGRALALVLKKHRKEPSVQTLLEAVERGEGGKVHSRLTDSFEQVMRFVLGVVVEAGECTREDVKTAFLRTLAWRESTESEIRFDRPFEEDIMEDIPSYERYMKEKDLIRVESHRLAPAGVRAKVRSKTKVHEVGVEVTGITCDCEAATRWRHWEVCKHAACAIHTLLFGPDIEDEARSRAIYACGHVFGRTLDLGTRLDQSLRLLTSWGLVERIPGGWRATPVGRVAASSWFDLLLVRQAASRVTTGESADYREIARWAVQDFFAKETEVEDWLDALDDWLSEVNAREIELPTRHRGDFERQCEDLSGVCRLYESAALAKGDKGLARAAHRAAGAVRYGVAPEVVPISALNFQNLGRVRARLLYDRGIRNVADLSAADPVSIADPRRMPLALVRGWVARAREIDAARVLWKEGPQEQEPTPELDELVSRFRLDPAAFEA